MVEIEELVDSCLLYDVLSWIPLFWKIEFGTKIPQDRMTLGQE